MNDKTVFRLVLTISIVVLALVIILNRKILPVPEPVPSWVYALPKLNALLNGSCFLLLIASFYQIKKKRVDLHRKLNLTTFFLSSLFLISYVAYHWMAEETKYPQESAYRSVYLIILGSHIILAAVVLPLVLLSFHKGLTGQVEKHRKLVRYTFPIWLYVTFTGVIVYLMISPYYPVH